MGPPSTNRTGGREECLAVQEGASETGVEPAERASEYVKRGREWRREIHSCPTWYILLCIPDRRNGNQPAKHSLP